jgi:uncharacterized protein YcbX
MILANTFTQGNGLTSLQASEPPPSICALRSSSSARGEMQTHITQRTSHRTGADRSSASAGSASFQCNETEQSPLSAKPYLANIRLHPIKSLDPILVQKARIGPNGGLENDRVWALHSADGNWVNGKRTAAIHLIRAVYAPDLSTVTLSVPDGHRRIPEQTFAFPMDIEGASEWLSAYFERQIIVRYAPGGFPDDPIASGPTIISSASLRAICECFPGMTIGEARKRFRTTLEIDGVPPFWEDQLFSAEKSSTVLFHIGEVVFEGSNPCARCAVPPRDPHTGADLLGFQKRFSEFRRAQLPAWSPGQQFDHFYRLATNTQVTSSQSGKLLHLGDPLWF